MVDNLFRKNIEGYLNLSEQYKKSVLFLEFEDFVTNPYENMNLIEEFIGEKFGKSSNRIMKRENCPRVIQKNERKIRIQNIKNDLSPKYKIIFDQLINDYDKKIWVEWNKIL
jgi:UDP-galactopyranose mutase